MDVGPTTLTMNLVASTGFQVSAAPAPDKRSRIEDCQAVNCIEIEQSNPITAELINKFNCNSHR